MLGPPLRCVGRDALIQDVRSWLDASQVVVLVGPPGIGKSTVAEALEADVWVSADGAGGVDDLVGRAARALQCPVERPEAVLRSLAGVELVVLDGVELEPHALDELLASWSARTRVVVTSRTQLPSWGPHLEVGPLDPDAGAAVLRGRIRDPRRAEAVDEAGLRALSAALDGVPLALGLVAERLRLHEPMALVEQVRLSDGPRTGIARALGGAMTLRLGVLSAGARSALQTMAWLPGTVDVWIVKGVVGSQEDGPYLELLDASLLSAVDGWKTPAFRMLAPVRAAVLARAADGSREQVLEALARVLLPVAEEAARGGRPEDLRGLGAIAELLELLTTSPDPTTRLRAALVLAVKERRTGPARATLERARRLPDEGPPLLRIRWGLMVAQAACGALEPDVAEEVLDRVAPLLGGDEVRADERAVRSFLALVRRDPALAAELAREAIALRPEPSFFLRLGIACFELGDQEHAASAFREARNDTDPFRRGHATYGLCTALMEQGVPAVDVLPLVEAGETEWVHAYPWLACRFHFLRGTLAADQGRFDEAQEQYRRAEELHEVLGEEPSRLFMELNRHALDFAAGRVPEELLRLAPPSPTPFGRAVLGAWRGITHAVLGHHHAAEAVGLPAIEQLRVLSPRQGTELGCYLAVGLGGARPELARTLVSTDDALAERARQVLDGRPVSAGDTVSERILAGIAALSRDRVLVARDGAGFVAASGERVDIARRKVLRRVLEVLAAATSPLDVDGICERVWPGETLVGQSGTRRVHVAISTLRGLGLREAIVTDAGDVTRWHLDADVVDAV